MRSRVAGAAVLLIVIAVLIWASVVHVVLTNQAGSISNLPPLDLHAHARFASRVLASILLAGIGILLVSQRKAPVIGWLVLAAGFMGAIGAVSLEYSYLYSWMGGGAPAGVRLLGWGGPPLNTVSFWLVTIGLPLVFPTGRLPSRRWVPVVLLATVLVTLQFLNQIAGQDVFAFAPPVTIESLKFLRVGVSIFGYYIPLVQFSLWILVAIAGSAVFVRYRRASGEERYQLRWIAVAGVLVGILAAGLLLNLSIGSPVEPINMGIADGLNFARLLFAAAAAIAIFKYRLYDIDVIISKGVIFGAWLLLIAVVHGVMLFGAGKLVEKSSALNSFFVLGLVAVGVEPVRRQAEHVANLMIYGNQASTFERLRGLLQQLSQAVDLETVLPHTAQATGEATRALMTSIAVDVVPDNKVEAVWTRTSPTPLFHEEAGRSIPIVHGGEEIGRLTIVEDPADPIRKKELDSLEQLISVAGLFINHLRLTLRLKEHVNQLEARMNEMARSHMRLTTADVAARHHLQKEVNERLRKSLLELEKKLTAAEELVDQAPEESVNLLTDGVDETKKIWEDLRRLSHGIFPSLLRDAGLMDAIAGLLAEKDPSISFSFEEGLKSQNIPSVIQSAIYYSVSDLAGALCAATSFRLITLRSTSDELHLQFEGVLPDSRTLSSVRDRIESLDGEVSYLEEDYVLKVRLPLLNLRTSE